MTTEWKNFVESLNKDFPLSNPDPAFPNLSSAIDDGVDDLLRDSVVDLSSINPLYFEDLLADCINRVSNCLVLREKANEVEIRAVSDALNYKYQSQAINIYQQIRDVIQPIKFKMGQYSTSIKTTSEADAEFFGNDEIWSNVKGLEDALSKSQAESLELFKAKASTSGNGSNYVERFAFLKTLFDISIAEAYRKAVVCEKAAREIYGIQIPLPTIKTIGYLNELAIWSQKMADALDAEQDRRYVGEIAFAVSGIDNNLMDNELLTKDKYTAQIAGGEIKFTLTSDKFEKSSMKNVLLRSMRLLIRAKDETRVRIWPVKVKLPTSTLSPGGEVFSCIASSNLSDSNTEQSLIRGVHNISPLGEWEISLPPRSITAEGTQASELTNIYIILRVSYRRL